MPVLLRMLMSAKTHTLTGCFAFNGKIVTIACQSLCRALPGLIPHWFKVLVTTTTSVTLRLHATLISKDHIDEAVASMVLGNVQFLLFVDITNELAVGTSFKYPSQRCLEAKDGPKDQCVPKAC